MIFILVLFLSISSAYCLYRTRLICYFAPNVTTDNEKMVMAAHEINIWAWPSKMHDISYNRSQLREYWTIILAFVSRYVVRDKSDWGNVVSALLSHVVSACLLFWLCSYYMSPFNSLLLSLLYGSLLWPYYIAIYTGHILLSQAFFIGALVCASAASISNERLLMLLAGVMIAMSFFSSSASRKYPILFLVLLVGFFLKDREFYLADIQQFLLHAIILGIGIFLFLSLARRAVAEFLMRVMDIKVDHKAVVLKLSSIILTLIPLFFLFIYFGVQYFPEFLSNLIFIFAGIVAVTAHILMPPSSFWKNIKRYGIWLNVSNWASHFSAYPDPIKTFGHNISQDFKGGGIIWLHKLMVRMAPEFYILWAISCFIIIASSFVDLFELGLGPAGIIAPVALSFVSPAIHYATGGLRVGKALFSVVLPMLVPIGIVLVVIPFFKILVIGVLIVQIVRTAYLLHTNIIPCRMAPTSLRNTLRKLGVRKFYTYSTSFNASFVDAMLYKFANEFEVEHVRKMADIESGYLVVPPTSSKSVSMETQQEAIVGGDFSKDPDLDLLILSGKIQEMAIASIPTMGSSKFFVQESEVTSYLDLMLRRVSDLDFFRGYAWVIEIKK